MYSQPCCYFLLVWDYFFYSSRNRSCCVNSKSIKDSYYATIHTEKSIMLQQLPNVMELRGEIGEKIEDIFCNACVSNFVHRKWRWVWLCECQVVLIFHLQCSVSSTVCKSAHDSPFSLIFFSSASRLFCNCINLNLSSYSHKIFCLNMNDLSLNKCLIH